MGAYGLQRFFDRVIGGLLVRLGGMARTRPSLPAKPRRVAFIKLWALGDSLVALPAIKAFKERNPRSRITILCRSRNKGVFEGQPFIDEVQVVEPGTAHKLIGMRDRFDVVFDLEPYLNISALIAAWTGAWRVGFAGQARSKLYHQAHLFRKDVHMVLQYAGFAEPWGVRPPSRLVPLPVGAHDSQVVQWFIDRIAQDASAAAGTKTKADPARRTAKAGAVRLIGVSAIISESVKSRAWPEERFAALATILARKGYHVMFLGGSEDKDAIERILRHVHPDGRQGMTNAAGLFSVRQSAQLMRRCAAVVSNDTGPMHLSAAMGTRTVGLFGPNLPSLWAPFGKGHVSLYHKVWCSPCIENAKGTMPACFNPVYQQCMLRIGVDEAVQAITRTGPRATSSVRGGRTHRLAGAHQEGS